MIFTADVFNYIDNKINEINESLTEDVIKLLISKDIIESIQSYCLIEYPVIDNNTTGELFGLPFSIVDDNHKECIIFVIRDLLTGKLRLLFKHFKQENNIHHVELRGIVVDK